MSYDIYYSSSLTEAMEHTPKFYPHEHPFNKYGYRYFLAEPDPSDPTWQTLDEDPKLQGKPIPGHLYRDFREKLVLLSMNDRG